MAYCKTETGQRSFKDRSAPLTARQRSAFILFDGKRSVADVLAATAGLGVTAEDVDHMVQMGLLEERGAGGPESVPAGVSMPAPLGGIPDPPAPPPPGTPQERYQRAYPIATRLTAELGLRGFRLNLAVEGAGSYEELVELAPRIREAVGNDRFKPLQAALNS